MFVSHTVLKYYNHPNLLDPAIKIRDTLVLSDEDRRCQRPKNTYHQKLKGNPDSRIHQRTNRTSKTS
ncbi:unnamed protein product [Caenorhabditis auriculariae]|uniref:Uncharacterized protein n=1 Tax=Caenorhabditis auriculariae TaxID=2777116 RepID=A0A8S1GTM8_9PELO|nr:unnamed protein product [Caenorhabditis auriculariae]